MHTGNGTEYVYFKRIFKPCRILTFLKSCNYDPTIHTCSGGVGNTPDNWGNDYFDDTYYVNGEPKQFKGYCTDVFFSEAIKFIEERQESTASDDDDKPFFVYIATNAPHHPFNVENKYADMYRGIAPTEDQARFYGMVTNIDENVGMLRSKLDDMGLADNTILIFMSDNGSGGGVSNLDADGHVTEGPCNYNAGMRGVKGWEYEGGHRVPFLLHCPPFVLGNRLASSLSESEEKDGSHGGGQVCNELTAYVDVMPTILDLTDTPVSDSRHFHGVSLGPLIRGYEQPELHERAIVTDTQRIARPVKWFHSSVMKNKWRLINGMELYNLETDPGQRQDIRDNHPELVKELRGEYDKWWGIVSEQFSRDVPYVIGRSDNDTVSLTAHDIRNEAGDVPWLQQHVRQAKVVSGYWAIDVAKAGTYTIELRRWPQSTGYTLSQGIDGDDSGWRKDCIQEENAAMYEGGTALPLRWAHIEIAGISLHNEVDPDAVSTIFSADLPVGDTQLFAAFYDKGPPRTIAPYYIYINKVA